MNTDTDDNGDAILTRDELDDPSVLRHRIRSLEEQLKAVIDDRDMLAE